MNAQYIPKKEDFIYSKYETAVEQVKKYVEEYVISGKRSYEAETLGLDNWFLVIKGYGLFTQRHMLALRLENAKLNKESNEIIFDFEHQIAETDNQIELFLSNNHWIVA